MAGRLRRTLARSVAPWLVRFLWVLRVCLGGAGIDQGLDPALPGGFTASDLRDARRHVDRQPIAADDVLALGDDDVAKEGDRVGAHVEDAVSPVAV